MSRTQKAHCHEMTTGFLFFLMQKALLYRSRFIFKSGYNLINLCYRQIHDV